MNKRNPLNIARNLIIFFIVFGTYYMISQYDKINDFYIQKKENYSDLKKMNNEILEIYKIDLTTNKKINDLKRKVEYDEHMINSLEPNTKIAKYYWWIIIGSTWILILDGWIRKKSKKSEKKTE